MAELNCPQCGVVNDSTRATCVACTSILRRPQVAKDTGPSPFNATPKPKSASKKKAQRKPRRKNSVPPAAKTEAVPTKDKPPKKRQVRRRRKKVSATELFMLVDGKLQPVSVVTVTKKIKPTTQAKALITLWNRNKGLLK